MAQTNASKTLPPPHTPVKERQSEEEGEMGNQNILHIVGPRGARELRAEPVPKAPPALEFQSIRNQSQHPTASW